MHNVRINPVILVGGTGTRLWPLSRANYPKQFTQLDGQYSLFQQTLLRLKKIQTLHRIYLVVNENNYFLCLDQLNDLDMYGVEFIVEPEGRNTAPAIAACAFIMKQKNEPEELMLVLPSDHKITDNKKFLNTVNQAIPFAIEKKLILFGVKPNEPSAAYGYIQAENNAKSGAKVKAFFEKPNKENATIFMSKPHCYWNSGMFLFSANTALHEIAQHAPDIYQLANRAAKNAIMRENTHYLHRDDFAKIPNMPIDVAVFEKTDAAYVFELQSDWSDLGDWDALHKNTQSDSDGNVSIGNVFSYDTKNSYLRSTDKLLATVGVDNLVVVASKDSVLIADKSKAQDVKTLVDLLKSNGYADYLVNDLKVQRPWGTYELIMKTKNLQVKHILLKPGEKLSLQSHAQRSEHWVIIKGMADVICGENVFQLHENESTFIPKNTKHRLINSQNSYLELIEVQAGDYIGEDDIVRYDT